MALSVVEEILAEYRPVGVALAADFLVFLTFWILLFLVHKLSVIMPLGDPVGSWFVAIHERAYTANYAVLAVRGIWDVIRLRFLRRKP